MHANDRRLKECELIVAAGGRNNQKENRPCKANDSSDCPWQDLSAHVFHFLQKDKRTRRTAEGSFLFSLPLFPAVDILFSFIEAVRSVHDIECDHYLTPVSSPRRREEMQRNTAN